MLGRVLETACVIPCEELKLFSLDNLKQQLPVGFSQGWMSFDSQQEGPGALAILADEPTVDAIQLTE